MGGAFIIKQTPETETAGSCLPYTGACVRCKVVVQTVISTITFGVRIIPHIKN